MASSDPGLGPGRRARIRGRQSRKFRLGQKPVGILVEPIEERGRPSKLFTTQLLVGVLVHRAKAGQGLPRDGGRLRHPPGLTFGAEFRGETPELSAGDLPVSVGIPTLDQPIERGEPGFRHFIPADRSVAVGVEILVQIADLGLTGGLGLRLSGDLESGRGEDDAG